MGHIFFRYRYSMWQSQIFESWGTVAWWEEMYEYAPFVFLWIITDFFFSLRTDSPVCSGPSKPMSIPARTVATNLAKVTAWPWILASPRSSASYSPVMRPDVSPNSSEVVWTAVSLPHRGQCSFLMHYNFVTYFSALVSCGENFTTLLL